MNARFTSPRPPVNVTMCSIPGIPQTNYKPLPPHLFLFSILSIFYLFDAEP